MRNKENITKILLTIPSDLKEDLKRKAIKNNRSLNNYVYWLLINRK